MNMWQKMLTALRGGVNEAGEKIVDAQAIRILDQEIRDVAEALRRSKEVQAEMMAKKKLADERTKEARASITEHEGYARQALEKGDESLALEVAQKIADLEELLEEHGKAASLYGQKVDEVKIAVKHGERDLKMLKQQADAVRANEIVLRAKTAVAERHNGTQNSIQSAIDSVNRIKERQAEKSARIDAASEMAREDREESLSAKLEKAGITKAGHSAQDVLARLKGVDAK